MMNKCVLIALCLTSFGPLKTAGFQQSVVHPFADVDEWAIGPRDFLSFEQTWTSERLWQTPENGSTGDAATQASKNSKGSVVAPSKKETSEETEDPAAFYGLQGEEMVAASPSSKMSFAPMPEAGLQMEESLLKEQYNVDKSTENTRKAFEALKAATSQSANTSGQRSKELHKLKTETRRTLFSAASNIKKAMKAHRSAVTAKESFKREQKLMLATAAANRERDLRWKAAFAALNDTARIMGLPQSEVAAKASAFAALDEDRLAVHAWEKKLLKSTVGQSLAALGLHGAAVGVRKARLDETRNKLENASKQLATAIASAGDVSPASSGLLSNEPESMPVLNRL